MGKKITASVTLAAFIVFTYSCMGRRRVPQQEAYGEDADVLAVLTTSGEHIEFSKGMPGRIAGDKVIGRSLGHGEIAIPLSQVRKTYRTSEGRILRLETTGGKTYFVDEVIKEDAMEIVIRPTSVDTAIPLRDIESVWIRKVDPGMTFLAILGGVGLAAVGLMAIVAMTKESCPFIYSFNGERYIFDAEPYGGAVCQGLKRTEWCALEEIKETDGRYKILVTNEVEETQYTDELKLVVVDHTPETRVVSDAQGKMHTVSNALSPRLATDRNGRDLLPAVGTDDWKFWLSRSAEMRVDTTSPTKEELVFEFPKPEGAKTARLIFNGCTTLWGSQMVKRFLDLHGNAVQDWYRDVGNQGPSLRTTALMNAREELYQLHIRVETARGWTSRGLVQGGGPLIAESRLYSFDIGDVPGDVLRIKLTPATAYWMINWLAVDYGEDQTLLVHEVAPLEAHDASGRDVRNLLLLKDGRYLTMPRTGDKAEVSFLSPPLKEGSRRSVFIKASGYYDIHLKAMARPQTEVLQRVSSEPGFITRYAIKEYLKWREGANQRVGARSN